VPSAFFSVVDETDSSGRYSSEPATGGPWSPQLQHGGPPSALAVHAAERLAAAQTGRGDLIAVRVAVDFIAAVPVAELTTRALVQRAARSAALVEVSVRAQDRDCLHARIWLVADTDTSPVAHPPAEPVDAPATVTGMPAAQFPYGESIEWEVLRGGIAEPGPGEVWARPGLDLIDGRPLSGLQRAALIGDSASGISAELDWTTWSFVNVDLDVHLARPMRGEWLHMDAATQLGPNGSALARSTLSDVDGPLGCTAQTLVLAHRRR
jgi:hypothetical protein